MLTQRLANIAFAAVVLAACVYFAVLAQGFEASGLLASSGLPSKFFPQVVLGFMALCAVAIGVSYARRGGNSNDAEKMVFDDATAARRSLLMLAAVLACYLVWAKAGFLPMAALVGPLSLAAMGVRSIRFYIAVYVLTALIYAVFTHLLGIQLV